MVNLLQQLIIFYINFMIILCLKTKNECGYKQCPQTRDGALNVHLIPHSHMDAGWVKTFDEYYYGTRASVSTANVQLIYHSVLSELLHDKRRKFTFSESAYFWRWWKEQRPNTRATFRGFCARSLVQEGRAEFAGGSWTQADSATVGYLTTLDMWTWGLRKLNDTLGPCGKPKAAWQIDTYGHTREQASLLAQMGFDGLFLGRVDHRERERMMEEDRMEFMWRGSDVLGKMSDIMTHTLYNLYNAPDGFCFDFLCNDEPVVDDPDSKAYNAEKRVNDFIAQIERQAKYYDHDNILVTMGGDFTYQSAANWFMNMDYLINHVKNHPTNMSDINIFYSSPSCYLKSIYLYGRRDKAMYTERGDHLPYGSDANTYWTGFYTSRPSFKYLVRRAHTFLQVVKHLTVISQSADTYELHLLRHAVGLALHHDAITGTSQQHVTDDFIRILTEAIDACTKKISNFLSILTPTWGVSRRTKNNQQFFVCHELNVSQCMFMDTQESILLLVYNPLSIKTYHYVRLPAIALHYSIRDYNDEEMEYQLLPLPAAVINLPGRSSNAIQDLVFEAENIPAMGYSAYFISPIRDQLKEKDLAKKAKTDALDAEQELIPTISNEFLKVTIDQSTGLLESINHVDGVRVQISQNFFAYSPSRLGLESGAYSFRPGKPRPDAVAHKVQYNTIRGSLVKEIRQRFTDWITQTIRLYRGEEFVELEWVIGPVPIGTDLGKEVVTIFSTNITNNGEFFTDSNGRQMMKRSCLNETAGNQTKKPVPACYFPVTSRICIRSPNSTVELCVLPDRSQGGTSYKEGEIELMVHRRLLTDDGFGLEETLNEEAFGMGLVVKGRHRIVFGNFRQEVDDITFSERISQSARRWEMEPLLFLTSGDKVNRRKWQNVRNKRYSALTSHGLPRHIHILTLEPWKGGSVLLRLENTHETSERGKLRPDSDVLEDTRAHITVELRKIFLHRKIRAVRETTLAANQWLEDARQMDWSSRYVYNGGDDGILAEDQVEDDGSATRAEKDSGNDSDENQDYTKKNTQKFPSKTRGNTKHRYGYDRKKRSINDSKYSVNKSSDKEFKMETQNSFTEISSNNTVEITTNFNEARSFATNTPQKLGFVKIPKQKKLREENISTSDEDFSWNLKKRPLEKRFTSAKFEEFTIENPDDGITRSMYDMYYKEKATPIRMKAEDRRKKIRLPEKFENITESSRRQRKRKRYSHDEPLLHTRRRYNNRMNRRQMENEQEQKEMEVVPKKVSRRGVLASAFRYPDDEDDDVEDYDDDENDDTYSSIEKSKRRWKRSHKEVPTDPNSSDEAAEPEYIVTLRPTQIRTFVVWFESQKKS